jgi:hypothetical protein
MKASSGLPGTSLKVPYCKRRAQQSVAKCQYDIATIRYSDYMSALRMALERPDLFVFADAEKQLGELGHHGLRHRARIDELPPFTGNVIHAGRGPCVDVYFGDDGP